MGGPVASCHVLQPRRGEFQVRNAMFDAMSGGLERAWDMVRKDGKITPENIKAPMREIRRALLEADVSGISPMSADRHTLRRELSSARVR